MHTITGSFSVALIFLNLRVWADGMHTPADVVNQNYVNDDGDVDDGLLQCYSCNSLLGDGDCENLNADDEDRKKLILTCRLQSDEFLPVCIFRKDDDFARAVGLEVCVRKNLIYKL